MKPVYRRGTETQRKPNNIDLGFSVPLCLCGKRLCL